MLHDGDLFDVLADAPVILPVYPLILKVLDLSATHCICAQILKMLEFGINEPKLFGTNCLQIFVHFFQKF